MAQTIWLHRLADELKARSEGMDYVCEHVFQEFESGSVKERFPLPNATAKDGSTYRALVCGPCAKNCHRGGNLKLAKEMVHA